MGRFELADGGTLFLDEIGNLPPAAQRMLLLALQDGQVTRLGETKPRGVTVKLVAATNADLRTLVAEGRFRADLYARLNPAARLEMPPLRDRMGDLQSLVAHFVRRCFAGGVDRQLLFDYAEACGLGASDLPPTVRLRFGGPDGEAPRPRELVFTISRRSTERLMAHRWSGNVRELQLFVANALLMTLVDATAAAEAGRAGDAPQELPVPDRLVGELLEGARLPISASRASEPSATSTPQKHAQRPGDPGQDAQDDRWSGLLAEVAAMQPGEKLRNVAQTLERAYLRDLFGVTGGNLELMAQRLLQGDPKENARRIRTRFQQLGLRVRALRDDVNNIKNDVFDINDASG